MPTIFGTKLIGILLATFAFFIFGWLWYGLLFDEYWLDLSNITAEQLEIKSQQESDPMMYVWGLLITFAQIIGLSWVFDRANAYTLAACAKAAIMIAVLFVLPILTYGVLYSIDTPVAVLTLDFGHTFLAYLISAAVLSFFRTPPQ